VHTVNLQTRGNLHLL